ncbi:MAG: hypothetical protein ABGY96_13690 [bacterium]
MARIHPGYRSPGKAAVEAFTNETDWDPDEQALEDANLEGA